MCDVGYEIRDARCGIWDEHNLFSLSKEDYMIVVIDPGYQMPDAEQKLREQLQYCHCRGTVRRAYDKEF
jgi:hypothetical protein